MFKETKVFSSFSVDDTAKAKQFYSETLGLEVEQDAMGLTLKTANGNQIFAYQKDNHSPASFTILNFMVDDIDGAVAELEAAGVTMERYDDMNQDEKAIARAKEANMGLDIAWFKDPAGNILSVLRSN